MFCGCYDGLVCVSFRCVIVLCLDCLYCLLLVAYMGLRLLGCVDVVDSGLFAGLELFPITDYYCVVGV